MGKIPFYIVSGFLGSGKTTFLKRIIEKTSPDKKIGIIQNEFAPANIDSVELKQTGKNFHLLEINNGSVFCVCLLGNFVNSLADFIGKYQPDLIVMEASGLSDTTAVSELLSSPAVSDRIFLSTNWCVVDALNFERTGLMQQRLIHQIRMADVLLINKIDLAGNKSIEIRESVSTINPFARIIETIYCNTEFNFELDPVAKFYFDQVKPMNRPDMNSMVIKSGRKISLFQLKQFLEEWAVKAYRIKGYVNLKDGITMAVQCIFNQISTKPVDFYYGATELIALSDQFTLKEWNRSFRNFASVKSD